MYWKQWLQTLLILVVLLGVLELLLPSGELARFSKLVLGLSLMLAVLQPLVLLFSPEMLGVDLTWSGEYAPDLQLKAERLQIAAARPLLEQNEASLTVQLEEALADLDGVENVQVQLLEGVSGEEQVQIYLEPFNAELRLEAARLAAALLNLPVRYIAVLPWTE